MPRVNLTDEEVEIIEARRRRNTAAIAHNRAIDLCIKVVNSWYDSLPAEVEMPGVSIAALLDAFDNLKEPLRN